MVVNWGQPMDLRQDFGSVYQMFIFGNISEQKTGEGSVVCVSMDLKLEAERHNSGTGKSSHTHTHTHHPLLCRCLLCYKEPMKGHFVDVAGADNCCRCFIHVSLLVTDSE